MKFVCLGYYIEENFAAMSESERNAFVDACFAYDDVLRAEGRMSGGQALGSARDAAIVRLREGKVLVTDGPFAETKEQLGGLFILEAKDRNEAIALMSRHPGLRAGPWEIRAVEDLSAMMAESEKRRRH